MKPVTKKELEELTDEEREYMAAKMDYERLGAANANGLNAVESMKLDMAYKKANERYFALI